ncbi:MAG: hypothetical protein JSU04_14935 [Bdellovibrionales bacterium]|nr:hypothetical protein [Bdellovibrionales bacterium]
MRSKRQALLARATKQRGSAILYALLVTLFMTFAFYGVSTLVMDQNRETKSNEHVMKAHLALHSMIDYTLLGLKKRWCFTDAWLPENTSACTLAHPASVERVIMGNDSARVILNMIASKQLTVAYATPLQLESFEKTISLANFSDAHPIYSMMVGLKKMSEVSSIRVGVYRDHRASLPQNGREVYLKIVTALLNKAGNVIVVGSSRLQATSYVGVYPRELSGFALILPRDLHLDKKSSVGLGTGDNFFQMYDSRATALKYPGISFDSPVFVNRDIILPNRGPLDGDTQYTPVSFNDRVVLGAGRVKFPSDTLYSTRTQGADGDQLWVQAREFGGFVKGIDVDGVSDAGLEALAGLTTGAGSPDLNLVNKCIERNKRLADLTTTKDSVLQGVRVDPQVLSGQFKYNLFLTGDNRFNKQRIDYYTNVNDYSKVNGNPYTSDTGKVAVTVKVHVGNLVVEAPIGDNGGYLEFSPKVDMQVYINKLKSDLQNAQKKLDDAGAAQKSAENALNGPPSPGLYAQLKAAQDNLAAEKAKPTPTPTPSTSPTPSPTVSPSPTETVSPSPSATVSPSPSATISPSPSPTATVSPSPTADPTEYYDQTKVDALTATINSLKAKISTQETTLAKAKADVDAYTKNVASMQSDLNDANSLKDKQPVIRIDLDRARQNPSYRQLTMSFTYEKALRDSAGNLMHVWMEIQAYDVSYYRGWSMTPWRQSNMQGIIDFAWTGTNFGVVQYLMDKNWNSRGFQGEGGSDEDLDALCSSSAADFSTAFDGADWNVSFLDSARLSWDFTGSQNEIFILNDMNASKVKGTSVFLVKSIAKECRIQATADFVAGFYTCDNLIIEKRTTPLRIIGTIIALKMTIDPSVYEYGLRWSSIFSPMSVYDLREAGILRTSYTDVRCQDVDFPLWHPYPSQVDLANSYSCNAISLRSKADPFTWTAVDPDCGFLKTNASADPIKSTVCKNRLLNFNVIEISRDAGI